MEYFLGLLYFAGLAIVFYATVAFGPLVATLLLMRMLFRRVPGSGYFFRLIGVISVAAIFGHYVYMVFPARVAADGTVFFTRSKNSLGSNHLAVESRIRYQPESLPAPQLQIAQATIDRERTAFINWWIRVSAFGIASVTALVLLKLAMARNRRPTTGPPAEDPV